MSIEVIDPRIRARRMEVEREAARRRVRITLAVASVVVIVGVAYLVVHSPLLDVDRVRVEGARNVSVEAVRAAAAVDVGAPMLLLDAPAVERRVEDLAWVANARVERALPATVRIVVREREVTAYVRRDADTVALLAVDGRVVADAPAAPEGAVEVVGVRRPPDVGALLSPPDAAGVVRALPGALAQEVARVDVAGAGITLVLTDGVAVRLGSGEDAEAKGAAALAVLERNRGAPLAYVDVRVPEHPVARRVGA